MKAESIIGEYVQFRIFNPGDIVYFKKERTAKYGSGEYKFNLSDRYLIEEIHGAGCCSIKNLEDGKSHFITSMGDYLISVEDRREKKLSQILE